MTKLKFSFEKPGLLVSVRNATEALTALAGGADVIDVKEPNRGSLGAADGDTISAVVRAVNGRAPVSAALGELTDSIGTQNGNGAPFLPEGVSFFKLGLAHCASLSNWRSRWQHTIEEMTSGASARPVAVVYADWRTAQSPPPRDVLSAAVEHDCPALLIDTWNKSAGTLFDPWRLDDLCSFLAAARSHDLAVVLAGSLTGQSIAAAARLGPDLVAVRSAACDSGREGIVSEKRVRELKSAIATSKQNVAAL